MTAPIPAPPDIHLKTSHLPLPVGLREGSLQNRWANACTAAGTGSNNYAWLGTHDMHGGEWRSGAASGKSLAGLLVFHRIAIDPQTRITLKWTSFSTSWPSPPTVTRAAQQSQEGLYITTAMTATIIWVKAFNHSGLQSVSHCSY